MAAGVRCRAVRQPHPGRRHRAVNDRIGYTPRFPPARGRVAHCRGGSMTRTSAAIAGHVREATLLPGQRLEQWLEGALGHQSRACPSAVGGDARARTGRRFPSSGGRSHPALVDG